MKKIGFVDYYLSEWHANNYPAWIREACEKAGADYEITYAWAEDDVSPVDGVTTDGWCEKFGATRCDTLEELCEASDVILILAPSNPEKHLPYAKIVLPYGKRTYIDKTFAPNANQAAEIFAIAKACGTPFFSTSALRYADEIAGVRCKSVKTTGGGRLLDEYIIHQAEMVVKTLGCGSAAVKAEKDGDAIIFDVRYSDDRSAGMRFAPPLPFTVTLDGGKRDVKSDFFKGLIADIVRFYETGEVSFDPAETMEVMRLREAALKAAASDGWVKV
ncbi:MAG: hypothetical protein IJ493_08005 [Clostridia bacterium]|nr:hypothetical protein [Clostridia bacterium]